MSGFADLLGRGRPIIGLWQALATPYTAEICATAGFDWLLFDGEHAPNTAQTLLAQLQAVSASPIHAIARPPVAEAAVIKGYLDLGFKTLLIPMVDDAVQASQAVAMMRFPPIGVRGVASALSRASGFGADPLYLVTAYEKVSMIAQIESKRGLENVEEIASTDGVDALFVGPSDLAASLGFLGNPRHPRVQEAIQQVLALAKSIGKPVGIYSLDQEDAKRRIDEGFSFLSVGSDVGLLATAVRQLAHSFGK